MRLAKLLRFTALMLFSKRIARTAFKRVMNRTTVSNVSCDMMLIMPTRTRGHEGPAMDFKEATHTSEIEQYVRGGRDAK